jgi:ring-1,2-phenylacetyl-CoA epoxidase subunit PaaE
MAFGLFKKSEKKEESGIMSGPLYYDLKVKEIIPETRDAISIVFEQPANKISYKAGQFLTLLGVVDGKEVRRAYSLCSSPFTDEDLIVTVKRVENGLMSNWLADNLKPGDRVRVMAPTGHFTTEFKKENKRHLVMFAGGSGITPMMSIIKATLSQEPDSICSLIYCNRDIDSIIFKNQLDQFQVTYVGRLHVIHVLDNAPMNWQGYSGLLNQDMLIKLFERIPDWGIERTTYLMCGPEGMMKNVDNLLAQQNISKEKIFKESFVQGTIDKEVKKTEAPSVEKKAREVTIRYDGQEYKFMVEPDRTILETALDQGIDLPYSCQSGL